MLAGGTTWYWLDDRNIVDWDFDSWEQRFSEEAYRFDNNEFPINFIGHALNGAAFYGLSRSNRMDVLSSFLYGAVTSFVWEFFCRRGSRSLAHGSPSVTRSERSRW